MSEFGNEVTKLGPLGKTEGIEQKGIKVQIAKVTNLVPYIKGG